MELIYKRAYTVCEHDVDCFGNAKLSTLLYYAQEIAGEHCLALGADADTLAEKNLFWAVTRHKMVIHRLPKLGECLTVETWPMPTTRVAYPRTIAAYDAQGTLLFQSISLWVLMDLNSRSMVLPGKSGIAVDGILRGFELDTPHSVAPKALPNQEHRFVTYSCLDRNGHMNNTYYLDWVVDLLDSRFHSSHTPREFTVCYLNEAREKQDICLHWELSDSGVLTVDAHRARTDAPEKTDRVFSAQMLF